MHPHVAVSSSQTTVAAPSESSPVAGDVSRGWKSIMFSSSDAFGVRDKQHSIISSRTIVREQIINILSGKDKNNKTLLCDEVSDLSKKLAQLIISLPSFDNDDHATLKALRDTQAIMKSFTGNYAVSEVAPVLLEETKSAFMRRLLRPLASLAPLVQLPVGSGNVLGAYRRRHPYMYERHITLCTLAYIILKDVFYMTPHSGCYCIGSEIYGFKKC